MTPTLQALARAYMALPGAPALHPDHDRWTIARGVFRTSPTGILWQWAGDAWLPDLTDLATGGVMLGLLPVGTVTTRRVDPPGYSIVFRDEDGRTHGTTWHDTLAEAVARVAVAVGRAG